MNLGIKDRSSGTKGGGTAAAYTADDGWLGRVADVMRSAHGCDVSRYAPEFLAKSLEKRLTDTASATAEDYAARLARDRDEAGILFRSLNIGYSEFFRDPLTFALLEQMVLPSLARSLQTSGRAELRVWSAGCAQGQEAWSVAMLLDELGCPYRIIATDAAEDCLVAARQGAYYESALQNVSLRRLRTYFTHEGESCLIVPRLRQYVDFSAYDLLDQDSSSPPSGIFGDFDLVLCCNVLLYYSPEARHRILERARNCLSPGGYLAASEAERVIVEQSGGFRAMNPPASIFLKERRGLGHRLLGRR